jgi:Pao retrotransposon peptidase
MLHVDNYLDSFDTDDEVVQRARQLKALLQLGGFNLTKWMSSKKDILSALKPFGLAMSTLDLDLDKPPMERTLGVLWNSDTDSFTFKIKQWPNSEEPLTKRVFLSIITSLYDPLGFVAPVTFLMKSLLKEIWMYIPKIDWDDPLPDELRQRFFT